MYNVQCTVASKIIANKCKAFIPTYRMPCLTFTLSLGIGWARKEVAVSNMCQINISRPSYLYRQPQRGPQRVFRAQAGKAMKARRAADLRRGGGGGGNRISVRARNRGMTNWADPIPKISHRAQPLLVARQRPREGEGGREVGAACVGVPVCLTQVHTHTQEEY